MDEIMIAYTPPVIDQAVIGCIAGLLAQPCCLQDVGEYRSLTLGFGKKIPRLVKKSVKSFCAEWTLGTYNAAWRIITNNDEVVYGSMNPVDSDMEMYETVAKIKFGRIVNIKMMSKFDIRVEFDNDLNIDFLCAANYDDELFSILGPEHLCVTYDLKAGWRIGKSNVPWE